MCNKAGRLSESGDWTSNLVRKAARWGLEGTEMRMGAGPKNNTLPDHKVFRSAICITLPGEQVMAYRVSMAAAALGVLALCCAQLAHGNPAAFTTDFGVPCHQQCLRCARPMCHLLRLRGRSRAMGIACVSLAVSLTPFGFRAHRRAGLQHQLLTDGRQARCGPGVATLKVSHRRPPFCSACTPAPRCTDRTY